MNQETGRRVALVTGSGRGIGSTVALALADANFDLVVNDLGCAVDGSGASEMPAEAMAERARRGGVHAFADVTDIADADGVEALAARLRKRGVSVDVLVNVAGNLRARMVYNMDDADWCSIFAVHLEGTTNTIRAFLPPMLEQGYGRIVNFTSSAGIFGTLGASSYSAAKAAVASLTRALAAELDGSGVTVNAIAPYAPTRIGDTSKSRTPELASHGKVNPLELNKITQRLDLPQVARADLGIAQAIEALVSKDAGDISGEVFMVSGPQISRICEPEVEMLIDKASGWNADELERYLPLLAEARA